MNEEREDVENVERNDLEAECLTWRTNGRADNNNGAKQEDSFISK